MPLFADRLQGPPLGAIGNQRAARWKAIGARLAAQALLGEPAGLAFDARDMSAAVKGHTTNFDGDANGLFTYSSPSTKHIRVASGLYLPGTTMRCEFDAAGAALGLLIEEQRTNVVLHNRDLTNAAWTKSNVTAAKDQTGIDGVANSASSITATAGNGTCLQAITLASSARYQTAFVKRITGSGTVEMTMDNGSTWTAVTVTSAWTRVSIPTQTLANPTVGFRIVTNGDAVAIDFVHNENGAFESSPIATTTASVTRAADNISLATSAFPLGAEYTLIVRGRVGKRRASGFQVLAYLDTDASNRVMLYVNEASGSVILLVTNGGVQQAAVTIGTVAAETNFKVAARIKADDIHGALDGVLATAPDTSASIPSVTTLYLGRRTTTTDYLNGHILKLVIPSRAYSNAELQGVTADPGPFDVFLVAGQSNCLAGKTLDAAIDVSGGSVFQWGRHGSNAGKVIPGHEPLEHNEDAVRSSQIGFAVAFARDYYVPATGRKVLLVPAAKGGTGFSSMNPADSWYVGDGMFTAAVASANAAMAANPGSSFAGILWHQGEANTSWTESQYADAVDPTLEGFRAQITGAENAPIVVGGMVPGWVAADAAREGVQNALRNIASRLSRAAYADPETPTTLDDDSDADLIHYGAADQRRLAARYWAAFSAIV